MQVIGPGVTKVQVGDPVVLSSVIPCGRCYFCVHGMPYDIASSISGLSEKSAEQNSFLFHPGQAGEAGVLHTIK